jgi:predicted Zn finger-like uncharacterized protein
MHIACSNCAATYLLPASLLGPAGARVRCPACGTRFRVTPAGDVTADEGPVSGVFAAPVAPTGGAHAVARDVIGDLVARFGSSLGDALSRQEVFSRYGAELLAAWDEYRRRAGDGAGSEPFRLELRERLGLDLFPKVESR